MRIYNMEESAKYLGIKQDSLKGYVRIGRIKLYKKYGELQFEERVLKQYLQEHPCKGRGRPEMTKEQQRKNFDARYFKGAYKKALAWYEKGEAFSKIAKEIGSETGVIWRIINRICPERARIRRERQHERAQATRREDKKQPYNDEMFKIFYRLARPHFPRKSIKHIQGIKRGVKVNGMTFLIRKAIRLKYLEMITDKPTYRLHNPSQHSDNVFYLLPDYEFLSVPKDELSPIMTTFIDSPGSKYFKFRNTFGTPAYDNK